MMKWVDPDERVDRTEIRCCCDCRLLGTLPIVKRKGENEILMLLPFVHESDDHALATVRLEWATLDDGNGHRWWALRAHNVPMESLRRIPGFEEA